MFSLNVRDQVSHHDTMHHKLIMKDIRVKVKYKISIRLIKHPTMYVLLASALVAWEC
jgi:hypothetical protein